MNQRKFINTTLIILVIILVGVVGYWTLVRKSNLGINQQTETQSESLPIPPAPISDDSNISGWKTYKNEKYGIEFKYPTELSEGVDTSELSTKYSDAIQTYIFDSGGELYNLKHGLAVSVISKALAYNGSGLPWWSGGVSVSTMKAGDHIWYLHPIQDEVCGGINAMTAFGSRTIRAYFTNACDDNDHVVEIDQNLIRRVLSTFQFVN